MLPPGAETGRAIALTLRAVGGLTTAEIAGAFLIPEATMAQRISRAKINEGYPSSAGTDLRRRDLSAEAIRLTRAPHGLVPDDSEVAGLLVLMPLTGTPAPVSTAR